MLFESGKKIISERALVDFLTECDGSFEPRLSARVDIEAYGKKLWCYANFVVARERAGGAPLAVAAFYDNDATRTAAFLSSLSVLPTHQGKGIARELLKLMTDIVAAKGFSKIALEVDAANYRAIALYQAFCFVPVSSNPSGVVAMERVLSSK